MQFSSLQCILQLIVLVLCQPYGLVHQSLLGFIVNFLDLGLDFIIEYYPILPFQ